ncbi:MAG: membrane protein insertion efficiency factor YidD [Campylobacteraceae bacterium]|jgi:putative membrane protein insertion efficiency factor|nr:membrane protein insertion efficiency factor YidD [Campylobacteraceae bacterium]
MIKRFFLWNLKIYQRFFTLFSFGSCRYYPTCSEYAKWQIENNSLILAIFATILRILRCNKLFVGGIDYPKIRRTKLKKPISLERYCYCKKIVFWFIPFDCKTLYVVKSL